MGIKDLWESLSKEQRDLVFLLLILMGLLFYVSVTQLIEYLQANPIVTWGLLALLIAVGGLFFYARFIYPTRTILRPVPTRPLVVAKPEIVPNSKVTTLVQRIQKFNIPRTPRKERDLELMLQSFLSAFYEDIRTQQTYQRARIDLQIENIGIELKLHPDEGELDRLYAQTEKYLQGLDYVIIVIAHERSSESTAQFRQRLKRRGWLNNRVFLITLS